MARKKSEKPVFVVVQEGGTSAELYTNTYDKRADANAFRRSAAAAAYKTTEVLEVRREIADKIGFEDFCTRLAQAVVKMKTESL